MDLNSLSLKDANELERLALLVEGYEEERFPIEPPSPDLKTTSPLGRR